MPALAAPPLVDLAPYLDGPSSTESVLVERLQRAERRLSESLSMLDYLRDPFDRMGWRDPLEQDGRGYGGYGGLAGQPGERKGGGDWQFRTISDLDHARDVSRRTCEGDYASGFLDRSVDFVIGDGMAVNCTLRGAKKGAVSTGVADRDGDGRSDADPRVEAVQQIIEEFRRLNQWGCGEEDREEEGFRRSQVDGEVCVRFFAGGADTNGIPRARWVEPEQIKPPGGAADNEKWGRRHDPDDVESVTDTYITDVDDSTSGEWVPNSKIVFHKLGTVRTVLRGKPLFWQAARAFEQCEAVSSSLTEVIAIQSKIAYVRQHATGVMPNQITDMVSAAKDYDAIRLPPRRTAGDTTTPVRWTESGQVVDMTAGMTFQAGPASTGVEAFVAGLQSRLRHICVRFGYPEFFTADASNNNLASILVTGGPFEKNIKRRQRRYAGFQEAVYRRAVAYAVAAGRISAADAAAVDIDVQPGGVAMENKFEAAQVMQIEIQNKTLSPQTAMAERGRDPAVELANIQALEDSQGGGAGEGDPFGGDEPPVFGEADDGTPFTESYTPGEYAILSEAARAGLVPKTITVKGKNGKTHQRKVMVRPEGPGGGKGKAGAKPDAGEKKPAPPAVHPQVAKVRAVADAKAAVAAAVSDPKALTADGVAGLDKHLALLGKEELKAAAKALREKVGGTKAELADRIRKKLRDRPAPAAADKPAPTKPVEPAPAALSPAELAAVKAKPTHERTLPEHMAVVAQGETAEWVKIFCRKRAEAELIAAIQKRSAEGGKLDGKVLASVPNGEAHAAAGKKHGQPRGPGGGTGGGGGHDLTSWKNSLLNPFSLFNVFGGL